MPWRSASTIGKRVVPSLTGAGGVWRLGEVQEARRDGVWPVGTEDPFFSSVSLLLTMDGVNGSTTFTDESLQGQTIVANGNAGASSVTAKYGAQSIEIPDSTSYLQIASDAGLQFGTLDFTVEGWFYFTGGPSQKNFLDFRGRGGPTVSGAPVFYTGGNRPLWFVDGTVKLESVNPLSLNTWHHLAVTRHGTLLRLFVNGQTVDSASDQTSYTCGSDVVLGGTNTSFYMLGFVDDLRITNGIARYTANFTPPTGPHPAY